MGPGRRANECNRHSLRSGVAIHTVLLLTAATLLLVTLAAPTGARADDTEVGGMGGGVEPIESTDIRLEAETVQVVLFRDFAEYRVDFRFENTGEERRVRLGFPFQALRDRGPGEWTGLTSVAGFRAWQDGRPLEVTPQLIDPGFVSEYATQGYFVHEATFPRGRSTLTVSYLAPPLMSAGSRLPGTGLDLHPEIHSYTANHTYWLHTGAGWAGTIGKAVVRYAAADTFLGWGMDITKEQKVRAGGGGGDYDLTEPPGWQRPDDSTYQWVFTDFEPVRSPRLARISPGESVNAEELAAFLRTLEGVERVEIRTAEEVRQENLEMERAGSWDPASDAPLPPPATRVDAYVDLVGAFDLTDAMEPIRQRLTQRFGDMGFDYDWDSDDPYPYDVRLAFNQPLSSDVPFGPRMASLALNGEEASPGARPRVLGAGDKLTFTLQKTPRVREVRIAAGDLSHVDSYSRAGRPKRVRLTFADQAVELEVKDEPGVQRFAVDASGEVPITLEVLASYPGTENGKAAVWNVEFGTKPAPEFTIFERLISAQPAVGQAVTATSAQDDLTTTIPAPATTAVGPEATPTAATGTRGALLWGVIAAFAVASALAAAGFFTLRARRT